MIHLLEKISAYILAASGFLILIFCFAAFVTYIIERLCKHFFIWQSFGEFLWKKRINYNNKKSSNESGN